MAALGEQSFASREKGDIILRPSDARRATYPRHSEDTDGRLTPVLQHPGLGTQEPLPEGHLGTGQRFPPAHDLAGPELTSVSPNALENACDVVVAQPTYLLNT